MKKIIILISILVLSLTIFSQSPNKKSSNIKGKTFELLRNGKGMNFIDSVRFERNNIGHVYMKSFVRNDTLPTYSFFWQEEGNYVIIRTDYSIKYFKYEAGILFKLNSTQEWIQKH